MLARSVGNWSGAKASTLREIKLKAWHAKTHLAVGTVHNHRHPQSRAVVGADDVERLLHAPALGDDVLDDQHFLTGGDFESAPQNQFAVVIFFRKNKARAQLPRHLLPDDQAAHRRGNDRGGAERPHPVGQRGPQFLHRGHLLQSQGALEELAAVQTAAQNEVPFQQRAGLAKNLQRFVLRHAPF